MLLSCFLLEITLTHQHVIIKSNQGRKDGGAEGAAAPLVGRKYCYTGCAIFYLRMSFLTALYSPVTYSGKITSTFNLLCKLDKFNKT